MATHIIKGEKAGESVVLKYQTSVPTTCPVNRRKISPQPDGFLSIDTAGMARRIDYEGNWCFKQTTITPLSSPQNNMAIGTGAFFRISGIGSLVITGLAGGSEGRRIVICYVGAASVRFLEDDAGSLPGNRMLLGNGGSYVQLATDHSIELIFDSTTRKWRRIGTIN
jgi:hypothetical protein